MVLSFTLEKTASSAQDYVSADENPSWFPCVLPSESCHVGSQAAPA
jgi:hypothetical protein